jgi:SAM-dependent methyltransferase
MAERIWVRLGAAANKNAFGRVAIYTAVPINRNPSAMRIATRNALSRVGTRIDSNDPYFDAAYYRRFYMAAATRAMSQPDAERRGALIAALVRQLDIPVRRVLDMGCGLGWFKRPINKAFLKARYTGVEFSEYLCQRYGWEQGSVVDYRGRGTYDLVLCCDVLQYLDKSQAVAAINNLARLCSGAVYVHVPTKKDWRMSVDPEGTDTNVHIRSGAWYKKQLRRHFVHVGQGVHVRHGLAFVQWELEEPWK